MLKISTYDIVAYIWLRRYGQDVGLSLQERNEYYTAWEANKQTDTDSPLLLKVSYIAGKAIEQPDKASALIVATNTDICRANAILKEASMALPNIAIGTVYQVNKLNWLAGRRLYHTHAPAHDYGWHPDRSAIIRASSNHVTLY